MNKKMDDLMAAIKSWHISQHSKDLQAAFEIGDLILNAVIMTGLKKDDVIRRIIYELKESAYSASTYRRAAHIATIFNDNQRQVLTDKGVSIIRTAILSGKKYDGDKRTSIIASIKHGDIKNWATIKGAREEQHYKDTAPLRHGLMHPRDIIAIQVLKHGEFQRDLAHDGMRSLVSHFLQQQPVLLELLNEAVEYWTKRKKTLKRFVLK